MATRKFKFKHIAQSASTHVGDTGELILDTATNTLKVSDGSTPGGVTLNTDGSVGTDIQTITSDGSTSSGSPTALESGKSIYIWNRQSSNTNYFSLPDATTAGTRVILISRRYNGGGNIVVKFKSYDSSGSVDANFTHTLNTIAADTNVHLLWDGDAYYITAHSKA
jgi:hypothetical protein